MAGIEGLEPVSMIREARQTDIPDLIPLAIEALKSDSYPELQIDRSRVFLQITTCVVSKANFACVSEQDGKIVGAMGVVTVPHAFYTGNQAVVVMWYSKKHGDGIKMMKLFMNWLKEKKSVNYVEYSLPKKDRERMVKILRKFGFNTPVPAFCMLR